jgi:hypothetical protein
MARLRLRHLGISGPKRRSAADVVRWLVAVQAQDFAGAKWSLGLRLHRAKDSQIERAFNDGAILRTHLLRPTWHFVTPADIRWLLALTAPRVHAANGPRYRELGLDPAVFRRSNAALAKAVAGGRHLTRDELRTELKQAGIATEGGQRMAYILMQAELEAVICSGPRRGKQFTYALLDERAPQAGTTDREWALSELSRRYFASRGPATIQDFAKWSGLTVADAGRGLESVKKGLRQLVVDGRAYWLAPSRPPHVDGSPSAHLLSIYDEYISSYRDRRAIVSPQHGARLVGQGNALSGVIVVDGRIVGTWKRTLGKNAVAIRTRRFRRLLQAEADAVRHAADRYGQFHDLPASLD